MKSREWDEKRKGSGYKQIEEGMDVSVEGMIRQKKEKNEVK